MKKYSVELLMFLFSLAAAYLLKWNNTDLIWSFWITSIVVGYVSIFRTTVVSIKFLAKLVLNPGDVKNFRSLPTAGKLKIAAFVLSIIPTSLFFIIFLSFHFCIFHLLIAYWLQMIVPNSSITEILSGAKGGEFYISFQIIKALFFSYWIIVIQKLIFNYRNYWKNSGNNADPAKFDFFSLENIARPYVQVVRIFALMVLLFVLNSVQVNQYLIYVMIYTLFFFPLPNLKKLET